MASLYDQDWESRLYNTQVGLDYRHAFNKVDFLLGGSYRSRVFNYVPNHMNADSALSSHQHQTMAHAYIGFASNDKDMPIQFQAEVGVKSFKEKYIIRNPEATKETSFYAMADVWKQTMNDSRFGLKVRFDNYAYSYEWADDVMALDFNPYYATQNEDWKVRLGVHVDWKSGSEDKVYVSPDVKVEYTFSDSYVLFAKAEGGRQISDLYEMADVTPYLDARDFEPVYMTLDAALGLKASPANGWWFLLSGGYQIRENDVCLRMGQGYPFWYAANTYGKTNVFYGTAELKHNYKDLLDFSLKGTYYHWEYKNGVWNGGDFSNSALSLKPELEINAEVGFKPIRDLRVNVGYEYVKRCNDLNGDPVNNLYAGADYALLKNLSVFAKFNNLLNKEYVASYAYPAQKLNFLAGLSLRF